MVTIAIQEEDFAKAKKIGEKFPNNEAIQSQMVTIAIQEGDFEKVQRIQREFANNEAKSINRITTNSIIDSGKKSRKLLNRLKTQLYYDKIDDEILDEIETSEELSEFEKIVSSLAVCEKRKMKQKAKEISKKFTTNSKKEKSAINNIVARIQSKKPQIFDFMKYDSILYWSFDEELRERYEEEKKVNRNKEEKQLVISKKGYKKDEKPQITDKKEETRKLKENKGER